MAAKSATVKIGDREKPVMVRELLLSEINQLMTAPSRLIVEAIANLLAMCSDIEVDELMRFAPSEIQPLVEKMLELNQAFFDQAATLQNTEIAADMRTMILQISMLAYLPSSPPATA